MLNYETILSSYDDKMTLMQWLKKVEEALNGASLTGVELKKKGNATFAWSFDFEDGTHVDTDYITIHEGESVAEAYLLNGHLMIKLTNDEVIDAGNLKPVTSFSFNSQRHLIVNYDDGTTQDLGLIMGVSSFSIDTNQHLIVYYDNGTTQDLGAIFSGNVNIDGNFTANTIIENMAGYSFVNSLVTGLNIHYAGVVKNGNKITYVISGTYTKEAGKTYIEIGSFNNPSNIYSKLVQSTITLAIDNRIIGFVRSTANIVNCYGTISKTSSATGRISFNIYGIANLTDEVAYDFRYEATFLLSDNLAGN